MDKRLDPEQCQPLKSIWRKLLCIDSFRPREYPAWWVIETIDAGYCLDRYLAEEPK